jgi:FKBP-type peptidyl-prolyl cis-trans isomerase FklB
MKLTLMAVLAAVTTTQIWAQGPVTLKDQKDKVSYSIGLNIGNTLKQQSLDLNTETLAAGIKDALSGGKALLTEEEVRDTLMAFQKEMMAKQIEKGQKVKLEGEKFLAENKKKKGVITLKSGLQYEVITDGKGKIPKATDTVEAHYRGTLVDGKEFDNSYKRKEPITTQVTGVIAGWTEALQLMKAGSKWRLFIPSDLAYGEQGSGPDILPNSVLIFEIELVGIKEEPKAKK